MMLWLLCEHGHCHRHRDNPTGFAMVDCPGGRPPTTEELIAELVERGVLIGDDYEEAK